MPVAQDHTRFVRRFSAPKVDLDFYEEPRGSVQHSLLQHANILACPRCGGDLELATEFIQCTWCSSKYSSDAGIPRLFFPHDALFGPRDVTYQVKDFYDANPFPDYRDDESPEDSRLARLLNERLPAKALVLDAGCGTGHLANSLALNKNRQVIGADLSLNSLHIGKKFKDRRSLDNAGFLQMNLFRPPFRKAVFDVVIANSVLHHTNDPFRGFSALHPLLKPDGLFVVSLFNPLGRAGNDLRRFFFNVTKDRPALLRWRNEYQRARFTQRYKQPWESRHFLDEIANGWFGSQQLEFVYSCPRIGSKKLSGGEDLRYARWPGDRAMRFQTELGMLLRGIVNDGLFVMIGRNKAAPKQIIAPEIAQSATA